MSRKAGAYYNEDDFDDGYEDDDYDDGYGDDYDEYDAPVAGPAVAKGSHGHKHHVKPKLPLQKPHAPAAAAGASALAQALSDPPPLRPDGRPQRGGSKHLASIHHHNSYPLSPGGSQSGGFDFNTPSPDDRAKAAGPAGRPTVGVPLAPSKTPTVKQQQQAAAARKGIPAAPQAPLQTQHSIDEALHDLHGLHLAPPPDESSASASSSMNGGARFSSSNSGMRFSTSSGGTNSLAGDAAKKSRAATAVGAVAWRPLEHYSMEPDLIKDVDAALASEAATGRRGLHLVVMGHVDAGKSTLMGRLLHELGQVSQKEVHKNQRESAQAGKASFSWAWVLDERPEERARGVTVDVAVARFNTPGHTITLLDAPGHRDFVPNMISGAGLADAALLLVDGSPGGFESGFYGEGAANSGGAGAVTGFGVEQAPGGQTQEHAQLARSLGVEQLAVVISKLDTCDFSQARFEYIKSQLLPFLKSVGFKESSIQWLPAVGPAGQNLVCRPTEPLLASWWQGPTLVQAIDAFKPKPRNAGAPLRIPIHDVFKNKQGAVCVGGKLEAGALKPGSKVMVVPGYETGVVKSLEVNGQDHALLALSGDSADIVISGLDASALHAGAVLCHPEFPVHLAVKLTVQVLVLQVPLPILKGHAVTIHAHTAREAGVISALLGLCDSKTGQHRQQKPRCLLSGQTAIIEVTPVRPLPLEKFSDVKALGRIALREGGRTVAVGVITGVNE